MNDNFFSQKYLCGVSERELSDLVVSVGVLKSTDKDSWECAVKLSGYLNVEYAAQESSAVNTLNIGLGYLRQSLLASVEQNEKLKFYEVVDDDTIERSIEDICKSHDCISEELEDMVIWAQNGGKNNS